MNFLHYIFILIKKYVSILPSVTIIFKADLTCNRLCDKIFIKLHKYHNFANKYLPLGLEKTMLTVGVAIIKDQIIATAYGDNYQALSSEVTSFTKESLSYDIEKLISRLNVKGEDISGIGIAIPESMGCPDALAEDVNKLTGVRALGTVTINARALGEAYLRGDLSYFVILTIGDTVESGIIIDKKLYTGINPFGGRVAHMVINYGGYDCRCGCKGCFEAYASTSGVKRIAAESGISDIESLTELFALSSSEAEDAKTRYTAYLSSGVTDVINLFQPSVLALEGEFYDIGPAIIEPMTEIVLRDQYSSSMDNKCKMESAMSENDTATLGAALLFR